MRIKKTFSLEDSVIQRIKNIAEKKNQTDSAVIEDAIKGYITGISTGKNVFEYKDHQGALAYNKENMEKVLENCQGKWKDAEHFVNYHLAIYMNKIERGEMLKSLKGKDFSHFDGVDEEYEKPEKVKQGEERLAQFLQANPKKV